MREQEKQINGLPYSYPFSLSPVFVPCYFYSVKYATSDDVMYPLLTDGAEIFYYQSTVSYVSKDVD